MNTIRQLPAKPANSRMLWMDIVRGAAILAVIAFHAVTMLERYGFESNDFWRYLNETLKLFRMPILIFLSGMLLPRSLAKPTTKYFMGKVGGILWPFLLWSTIYAVVVGVDFTSPDALRHLYTGGSYLWFLAFIFVYYMAAKPLESANPFVIAIIAFLLSIVAPDGEKYSERILFLLSLFFLGSAVARHAWRAGEVLASRWIWLLAPFVAAAALATVLYNLDYGPNWAGLSLAGILFFAAAAMRIEGLALAQPLIWIGQRSIVFYVIHGVVIIVVAKALSVLGMTNYALAAITAVGLALAAGSAFAVGMEKWPPLGWLFSLPVRRRGAFARQLQPSSRRAG